MNKKIGLVRIDSNYLSQVPLKDIEKLMLDNFVRFIPSMAKRQKRIGTLGKVLEDGNYFDLFIRARDNYIFGWFSSTIALSRIISEQICIKLLEDSGFGCLKWENKMKHRQKTLNPLINVCKNKGLLNKTQSQKLMKIKKWSEDLIHAKDQLKAESIYTKTAFASLELLGQVISEKFDYMAKTGRIGGYRYLGQTKRL